MRKMIFVLALLAAGKLMAQSGPAGLQAGDKAPVFNTRSYDGKPVQLEQLLSKGPVVLLFYRGQWCPFCNKQLKHLQDSLPQLMAKGAQVVAVTPETPANVQKTIEKTSAGFTIIADSALQVMKSYDVAFTVDDKTVEKYKSYGIDFDAANGRNGKVLPVPAVYIISREGVITYRYFDTDYRKRPSVKELLEHL